MASRKTKKPNYFSVIFLGIIFIVLFFWVKDDIQQYMDIVDKRVSINEFVRKDKTLDAESIEALYQECNQELQNLSQKSKLGKILVDVDASTGTMGCYIITTGIEIMMLFIICAIVFDLFIQSKRRSKSK